MPCNRCKLRAGIRCRRRRRMLCVVTLLTFLTETWMQTFPITALGGPTACCKRQELFVSKSEPLPLLPVYVCDTLSLPMSHLWGGRRTILDMRPIHTSEHAALYDRPVGPEHRHCTPVPGYSFFSPPPPPPVSHEIFLIDGSVSQ